MTNIEDTLTNSALPCNSKAMVYRLLELLEEHETNSLESCRDDPRVKKVLWLINSQVYGQLARIDMCREYDELVTEETA